MSFHKKTPFLATREGGGQGVHVPSAAYVNFRTKQGPTVSISNMTYIAFYGCSEVVRTKNFSIFTVYATIFGQCKTSSHFF